MERIFGMVNYLGQHIPNLSEVSYLPHNFLKKSVTLNWSHEHSKGNILTAEPYYYFLTPNNQLKSKLTLAVIV